jgi:hypothetical protein
MTPLSKDLREFIHLLNREGVEHLINGEFLLQNKRASNRNKAGEMSKGRIKSSGAVVTEV